MILIEGGTIVDSGKSFRGFVVVDGDRILQVESGTPDEAVRDSATRIIDASDSYVSPGVIDDQVHFRQPGAEQKGNIRSESRAAAAGGVTSFMDMPNTTPQTTTVLNWQNKMDIAADNSAVNYAFYFGATNSNMDEIRSMDRSLIPGVKVFMGSSTGGMLVDDEYALSRIFSESESLVAIHSEDESIIRSNLERAKSRFPQGIPYTEHPSIRSREACVRSTEKAMELAAKYGTRLHVLHVSTEQEVSLMSSSSLSDKQITAEACIPHIKFSDEDYPRLGALIKCNPAVKSVSDREAIRNALTSGKVDIVATDHAPHTFSEKQNDYLSCPSGMPMIQHSLPVMLSEGFKIEDVVSLMSHRVADLFHIDGRGYLRKDFYADIAVVRKKQWTVSDDNILYRCGWSPLTGEQLDWEVSYTIVSGKVVYENGNINDDVRGQSLRFI